MPKAKPKINISSVRDLPSVREMARQFRPRLKRRRRRAEPRTKTAAETLVLNLFKCADVVSVTETDMNITPYGAGYPANIVHLLVSIEDRYFDSLCSVGAELEDDEDSCDDDFEPDEEPSLVPAADGQFGFGMDTRCTVEDGEGPVTDDGMVLAGRQRLEERRLAGNKAGGEIRTGAGLLAGRERVPGRWVIFRRPR